MSIVERVIRRVQSNEQGKASRPPQTLSPTLEGIRSPIVDDATSQSVEIEPESLKLDGMKTTPAVATHLSDQFRVIKRPILANAESRETLGEMSNLVMVASALPGSGKTFSTINLGLSIASELDWTVLLVDADLAQQRLTRCLKLRDAAGLVDLLDNNQMTSSEVTYRTSHDRLQFIPAGSRNQNIQELLSSQRMRRLTLELAQQDPHRVVIFDSAPLLITTDARVLTNYVGQVVMIVEAERTPRRSVMDAIELIDSSKAVNLVLNKSRQMFGMSEYGYGYGSYGSHTSD